MALNHILNHNILIKIYLTYKIPFVFITRQKPLRFVLSPVETTLAFVVDVVFIVAPIDLAKLALTQVTPVRVTVEPAVPSNVYSVAPDENNNVAYNDVNKNNKNIKIRDKNDSII